ncbi:hypothetical protein ACRRTK_020705 [Alexandromys fortis]
MPKGGRKEDHKDQNLECWLRCRALEVEQGDFICPVDRMLGVGAGWEQRQLAAIVGTDWVLTLLGYQEA